MDKTLNLTREDVQQRIAALDWSQNELARRIKKNPGYVSGVLSGKWTSSVVWARIAKVLDREERRRGGTRNGALAGYPASPDACIAAGLSSRGAGAAR